MCDFLLERYGEGARILAPTEFHEIFPNTFSYNVAGLVDPESIDVLVIHKGMLAEIGKKICSLVATKGHVLLANEVFVVFALKGPKPSKFAGREHVDLFYQSVQDEKTFQSTAAGLHSEFPGPTTVILMTTYNRPHRLARSLETILPLNAPILVVNDASDPMHAGAYAGILGSSGVRVLNMPDNRGLSNALNAGLSYWLADPLVEWICYLQDDVEVRPDLLAALARVQHPEKRPILTGRHNSLQKTYGEGMVNGIRVLYQRMSPGIHLHAHRSYWEKMIPIPTVYFQAPRKRPGAPLRGADEDWWITQWSPHSIVKRGGYVTVVPDLVRTTTVLAEESTWGNPGEPDPPLPPPQFAADDFHAPASGDTPEVAKPTATGEQMRSHSPAATSTAERPRPIMRILGKIPGLLKKPRAPVFLKQYGERRTGTNYLRAILLLNHPGVVPLMHVLGDKHALPVDFESHLRQTSSLPDGGREFVSRATFAASAETTGRADDAQLEYIRTIAASLATAVRKGRLGFLISVKHPYSWASSLAAYSGWTGVIDGVVQMNRVHGSELKTACVEFNKRHEAWLALHARNRGQSVLVKYEELLAHPGRVMAEIESTFRLRSPAREMQLPTRKVQPTFWDHHPPLFSNEPFDPEYYRSQKYKTRLCPELWEIVRGTIDWKLMALCGYQETPLPLEPALPSLK